MLRVSRVLALAAALLLVGVAAGCGGSKSTAPTTTPPIPTLPKKTTSLRVENFPAALTGDVTYAINAKQGNPKKPHGREQNYTVKLDNLVLRLTGVAGKGNNRKARYSLQSSDESFTGSEVLTTSKCKTTQIVWAGSGQKPTGTVEVFSPKFDGEVGFVFLVPQRGKTLTRPCTASSGGTHNTVTRTARIQGNANLKLEPSKTPSNRFSIQIEVQSSTAGPEESGGYSINGKLVPAKVGIPVQICRQTGTSCHRV